MSGRQEDNLDPRLGASSSAGPYSSSTPHYTQTPPQLPPPVPAFPRPDHPQSAAPTYKSPQGNPYYHYPSPQQTHTPQQSGGPPSGAHSNQASPEGQFHAASEDAGSPGQGEEDGNAEDQKRPRACEACRGLKVRCDQDPAHPEIPCKRCAKAGRPCIITQPSRRRQKKSDNRVAELEKKLDALTAALHQQQAGATQYTTPPQSIPLLPDRRGSAERHGGWAYSAPPIQRPAPTDVDEPDAKRRRTTETLDAADYSSTSYLARFGAAQENDRNSPPVESANLKRYLSPQTPQEFIDRINALINPEMATTIFNRYVTKLAPHLPAVVFPPGTTAERVFQEKPILYVCILSTASHGQLHPDISKQIAKEAVGAIADCVVRNGAKSLELIQAMQVTALWYKPPEKAEQTNFYQIIHMAAVMALDIGLGKRFNPKKARRGFGGPNANYAPGPHKTLPQDSDTLEARRAWLGCYFLCASASMVLRRPNLIRWTNYMKECIEVLETHLDAFPSDKLFCQHIKIQHICEEIGLQFLMDDSTATISITDPKVTYALSVLETKLKDWKEQIPPECQTSGLQFFEHVTALYLHEIALHFNHNVEDFRLPFTEESLKSVTNTSDTLTQSQMSALEACLKAAHGILNTILSMDIPTVKTLPMLIFFVRCTYAIVILIKMHVAICTPGSELGKIMQPEDLKVEHYMDSLIGLFSYVAKEEEFRPHPKILRILNLLRDWFGKHKESQLRGDQTTAKREEQEPVQQTPLHLLSQVATGSQQATRNDSAANVSATNAQDWTFNNPGLFDYRTKRLDVTDATFPINQQQQPGQGVYPAAYGAPDSDTQGLLDSTNPDYGYGTNFEQAMEMALGGMDGLPAGGLDGWFLGDSLAPFGLNGEMMGQGKWGPG